MQGPPVQGHVLRDEEVHRVRESVDRPFRVLTAVCVPGREPPTSSVAPQKIPCPGCRPLRSQVGAVEGGTESEE